MLSEKEIIKFLVENEKQFSLGIGYPGAEDTDKEFFNKVGKYLGAKTLDEVYDIEEKVINVVENLLERNCKLIKCLEGRNPDYREGIYLYQCTYPDIGKFYVVVFEEQDNVSGKAHVSYEFHKDYNKARKSYLLDYANVNDEIRKLSEVYEL